ncbi:MAG: putative lipoprotein [Parcubacteria group bacterium]|nr:putative lipoprotein [Parcubacteria group bacterium]
MKSTPSGKNIGVELSEIFEADQAERTVGHKNIDFGKMRENDKPRLARARAIYEGVKEGAIDLNGEELWKLGMLFQHSSNAEDYLIAIEIGNRSAEAGCESGAWLSAAAEDRYLLNTGGKQKWGTQFNKEEGKEWEQMPMQDDEESGITDEMRAEKNLPARDQQMSVFLARDDI